MQRLTTLPRHRASSDAPASLLRPFGGRWCAVGTVSNRSAMVWMPPASKASSSSIRSAPLSPSTLSSALSSRPAPSGWSRGRRSTARDSRGGAGATAGASARVDSTAASSSGRRRPRRRRRRRLDGSSPVFLSGSNAASTTGSAGATTGFRLERRPRELLRAARGGAGVGSGASAASCATGAGAAAGAFAFFGGAAGSGMPTDTMSSGTTRPKRWTTSLAARDRARPRSESISRSWGTKATTSLAWDSSKPPMATACSTRRAHAAPKERARAAARRWSRAQAKVRWTEAKRAKLGESSNNGRDADAAGEGTPAPVSEASACGA